MPFATLHSATRAMASRSTVVPITLWSISAIGCRARRVAGPLEDELARDRIDLDDFAGGHAIDAEEQPVALDGRIRRPIADLDLVLLLRVEAVAVEQRVLLGTIDADVLEEVEATRVVDEIAGRVGRHDVEVAPPHGLVLAAVPLQQVREHPAGMVSRCG